MATVQVDRNNSTPVNIQNDRASGLSASVAVKGPCFAATTANITLSGEQTIDGVSVTAGKRVLVKDQTDATTNGIWEVSTGDWQRAADFKNNDDVKEGTQVRVTDGTAGTGVYVVTTADPITIGTTNITIELDTAALGGALVAANNLSDVASAIAALKNLMSNGANIATANPLVLDGATGDMVDVTGNINFSAVTLAEGKTQWVRFTGTPTMTVGASLIADNGGSSITFAAGDIAFFRGYASGVVRALYFPAAGIPNTKLASMAEATVKGRASGAGTGVPTDLTREQIIALLGLDTAETRNRLVNPAMQISQENSNTAGTTSAYYGADQWATFFVTSAGTITTQRVQSVTPQGAKDRYRVTITAADASLAAGEFLAITQNLEGNEVADLRYGSASAKQAVLRFGFKGPQGTYAVALRNSAADRSYVALFTISAGQANTDTEQTVIVAGDASGTWLKDTGVGITLDIVLACGSTFQGTTGWQAGNIMGTSGVSNGMATINNVFEIFDVGLYADPDATGVAPAWEMPDAANEKLRCRRYWRLNPYLSVTWATTTLAVGNAALSPPMPAKPTAALVSGTNAVSRPAVADYNITGINSITGDGNSYSLTVETATATAFETGFIYDGKISLNARLS